MEFRKVQYFLEVVCDKNIIVLALIFPLRTTEVTATSSFSFEHLLEAKKLNNSQFIKVEDIQCKCIFLEVDIKPYIVWPVHNICMNLSN